MTSKSRTLWLVAGFIAFSVGSFIWFILTWDPAKEDPVVHVQPHIERGMA